MEMPHSGQARFWEKSISLSPGPDIRDDDAAGEGERRFQRIRQAGADIFAQNQAVYDDLDVVLFLFGQRGASAASQISPSDPDADKPA